MLAGQPQDDDGGQAGAALQKRGQASAARRRRSLASRRRGAAAPLGEQVHTEVYSEAGGDPVAIARAGVPPGAKQGLTPVIVDTAGRLAIDEALMKLAQVKAQIAPQEILLVLDALTGQDALATAQRFDQRLDLTGLVRSGRRRPRRRGALHAR